MSTQDQMDWGEMRRTLLKGALGMCVGTRAMAQDFPSRYITFVSPYAAGGVTDAMARSVAEAAAKDLGQSIVIMNKPGAEGLIGSMEVAKAKPDGYTILLAGSGSLMVGTAIRKEPPYDPIKSFTPIAASVEYTSYLYVHPSFPASNSKKFVAYVKANPGKVAYATAHNQGMLQMADLAHKYGLDMLKAEYKGESAAAMDLITNRVQAIFATPTLMSFVKEGKLKVLATSLPKRSPITPEVPTLVESGTPAAPFGGGFLAIYGPPNLPKPIAERLTKAFNVAFKDPVVQEKLRVNGMIYSPYVTAEQLGSYNGEQQQMYVRAIDELGIPKR